MPNTRNEITASLKPIIYTGLTYSSAKPYLPAALRLPPTPRAKAKLVAGPISSKRVKSSVPVCWRES